jgi:DNA-binding beta-propeller fold protein YncE
MNESVALQGMKLMNKGFIAVIVAGLGMILVSVSVHAGNLTFDDKGNLFVADDRSHSIFKFTPDGTKSTFATGLRANGLAFDGAGNLFVSDQGSHSIFKFTPDGKKSTFATGLSGVAFDHSGNFFVSNNIKNSENFSIFKFTSEGVKSRFASGLNDPIGLACDGAGNLFVSDIVESSIFKFTPDGNEGYIRLGASGPARPSF